MKLHLYVFSELLVGFAFTMGGILVLTLPAIAAVAVHKLAGVEILLVLQYIPLVLAGFVPYVLPLAFLLAVVSTYGRLAADNEWTAIRMSGRNPLSMFLPGAVLAAILGVLTLWLLADKLPEIRTKQTAFQKTALADTFRHFSPGHTEIHIQDFYVSATSREGDDFIDAFVFIPPQKSGEAPQTILAERVRFSSDEDSIYAHFTNAHMNVGGADVRLGTPVVRIDLSELRELDLDHQGLRYWSSARIRSALDAGAVEPKKVDDFRYEIHYRRALAVTCLMFLFLGAPTALLFRRGTQLAALAIAVGYALVYYVLSMRIGKLLAQARIVPPEWAAWAVIVLGFVGGSWLTWKALRE